jgi:hypothetical protein
MRRRGPCELRARVLGSRRAGRPGTHRLLQLEEQGVNRLREIDRHDRQAERLGDEPRVCGVPRVTVRGHDHRRQAVRHGHLRHAGNDRRVDAAAEAHDDATGARFVDPAPKPLRHR